MKRFLENHVNQIKDKIHPHWNAILYVVILLLIPISVLTLPLPLRYPFQITTPPSTQLFVYEFGNFNATYWDACGVAPIQGGENVTVGEVAIQMSSDHGSLTASTPLAAKVSVYINETNFCLTYGPWFLKPSDAYVYLHYAHLYPVPEVDQYGLPSEAGMWLSLVRDSNGVEQWTNTTEVKYVSQGTWGWDLYLHENSTGVDTVTYPYPYSDAWIRNFKLDDGTIGGVIIEPFSVAVSYETNSLIASFTIFLIVLACLDSRTLGYRRHKKIESLRAPTSTGKPSFCSNCGTMLKEDSAPTAE